MKSHSHDRPFVFFVVALTILVSGLRTATAEAADDPKAEALKWIDSYRKVQVMFHDKDIERVRKKLEEATPEKAAEWLKETEELRTALDSKEWKETRDWLKEFLKVQAIYSDKQIEAFRDKAAKTATEAPRKMTELLAELEAKRREMVGSAKSSAQLREQQVQINEAYRQQQVAERDAIRREKAEEFAAADPGPGPQVKRRSYQSPPPLVDSLDVARWSVMRNFLPRW